MNFIDKYKQDIEKELDMDNMDDDNMELLKAALAHAIMSQPQNKDQYRKDLNEELVSLAETYCDVVDVFRKRLKGKMTMRHIKDLAVEFFDTTIGVILNG